MSGTQVIPNIQLSLAGRVIPCMGFDIVSGSYGSIGHASAETTVSMLRDMNLNVLGLQPSIQQIETKISAVVNGSNTLLFGGDMIYVHFDYDNDVATFHMRDYAGVLVDQRRALTSTMGAIEGALAPLVPGQVLTSPGIQTENQTAAEIVTSIANMFGLTPVLNVNPMIPLTGAYGTGFGSSNQTAYSPIPQTLWAVLVRLAAATGNEIFVTPQKQLYFGVPGGFASKISLSFNVPNPQAGRIPIRKLRAQFNTRRNTTFRVLVISYNPSLAQTSIGRATVIGDDIAGVSGIPAGMAVGPAALAVDQQLVHLAQQPPSANTMVTVSFFGHVQLYTFHWDGLTNAQANALAASYATDIMKRSITVEGDMDIYPFSPSQQIDIAGTFANEILGQTFYIVGYRHHFRMGGRGRATFITSFSALNLPTQNAPESVSS